MKNKNGNNSEEIKISEAFEMSLFNGNIEVIQDLGEIGLDLLFEDGSIIEQIPILKVGMAVCKSAVGIRDRILFKKAIEFIQEFNNGTISEKDLEKHKKKLNNKKQLYEEYEYVIKFIDLCSEKFHAEMLARFYRSYILEEIKWDKFCELSEAIRRMFVFDCTLLKKIAYFKKVDSICNDEEASVNRLYSLGLVIDERLHGNLSQLTFTTVDENGNELDKNPSDKDAVVLTKFGTLFCKYLDISINDALDDSIQ